MKIFKISLFLFIPFLTLLFLLSYQVRDFTYQNSYDLIHKNKTVETRKKINSILETFEIINTSKLPIEYLTKSKINNSTYSKMYKKSKFYIVKPKDIYKNIVGNIRIKDLLSTDYFYKKAILDRTNVIYWHIDKKILFKLLALRKELKKNNYNENGFWIRHGYRTPTYNEKVGGASKSRHIKGEAVDMVITDINKDGKYTDEDKQIVLNILETKIIKNQGGIGKYPETRTVHIDVRGYRARWDSY